MTAGRLGAIVTPRQGNRVEAHYPAWCADNGCGPGSKGIAYGYPGDVEFLAWLAAKKHHADRCSFAVAPDVVGDAKATLARFKPFSPVIRAMGFKVALAAQDGLEDIKVPWDTLDVLFIGGTTGWKLGAGARRLVAEALREGKPVHMGRVNSMRRLDYARAIGCDSADGTFLTFAPDINLPKLLGWLDQLDNQPQLWSPATEGT